MDGLKVINPAVNGNTTQPALAGQINGIIGTGAENLMSWAPHPNPPALKFPPLCVSPFIAGQEPTSINSAGNLLGPGDAFGVPLSGLPPRGLLTPEQNTFFQGGNCDIPVGIGVGTCAECRSAWGLGFSHAGRWYKVRGGSTAETRSPNGVLKGGIADTCVAHGTSSAKVFVVDPVELDAPPAMFAAPLRFVAR